MPALHSLKFLRSEWQPWTQQHGALRLAGDLQARALFRFDKSRQFSLFDVPFLFCSVINIQIGMYFFKDKHIHNILFTACK